MFDPLEKVSIVLSAYSLTSVYIARNSYVFAELAENVNAKLVVDREKAEREKSKAQSDQKRQKDKEDREKQKQKADERKEQEKKRTQKGERRR